MSNDADKRCSRCERDLPREAFAKMRAARDGLQYTCRECQKARWDSLPAGVRRNYYKTHDEREREARRLYAEELRRTAPDRVRRASLMSLYGLTLEQYDEIMERQGGACAICAGQNLNRRRLSVDHNHATGEVRGLLCNYCNSAIGYLRDNPDLIIKAYHYITTR